MEGRGAGRKLVAVILPAIKGHRVILPVIKDHRVILQIFTSTSITGI